MQSIGERLEEARKRKGISLREAAEATKIRGDFLGYFEQNKFDFELPELYKRGFIKNYARYLKLDPEKIITDYSAQLLSNTRISKKGGSELFGQIEIKKSATSAADESTSQSEPGYGHISSNPAATREDRESDDENDKTFYLKIGLVFVGTLTLVFVIFGLIKAILSSGDEPTTDPEFTAPTEITEPAEPSISEAAANNELKLIASGTVYVMVKQQSDNAILYRDTMSAGETVAITKNGPVDILFTAGENIVIEQGGERMRPNSDGTAKITLP
ncbi:MAG: helix-turn-helix domain-containing protein [Opitutales bacterium]|jgi:cytoskeleton protein RodZ|nr:helix-turn-helix domain-containing protein [Opitutales bacterium]MDP4644755.1 helix-turn-helix domain-containing protein [Opitutales bacterium]MDP4880280.1 helix-turn-helix domain-containing protein [Opitutales bacterium]